MGCSQLFKQEYQVLYNLTQQGIKGIPQVESNDYFQYQTRPGLILHCIIMEKVEGIDLEQWVKNNGQISQKQAFKWLKEVTQILGKIHQENYFHRDIKPQNIMQRNNGELVLIDFGTAREQNQNYYQKLQKGNVTRIGSEGYTPDEQKSGGAVVQSDFFALGRTFVHLLTGKHPSDMYDAYNKVLNWRNHTTNINPLLLDFVDELMAVSANRRPANTGVILQRLNQIEAAINSPKQPDPDHPIKQFFTIKNKWVLILLPIIITMGKVLNVIINAPKQPPITQTPSPPTVTPPPTKTATDYYNEGLKYYNQKEYAKAIASYTKAIEINPKFSLAYNNRGVAYDDLEKYPEAILDYNRAIQINDNWGNNISLDAAYFNRGFAYDKLLDYEKAIASYDKAIEINPNYADAYFSRGVAYSKLPDYEKAIASYDKAIEINPNYADAYYNRGLIYNQILQDNQSALSDFRQAARLYQQQGNTVQYNNAKDQIRALGE